MKSIWKTLAVICFLFFTQNVSAQTSVQYSYDQNGNRIQRKLIVCNNCSETGKEAAKDTTTEKLATRYGVSAYPNPTLDKVNLNITNLPDKEQVDLELTDPSGKNLFTKKNVTAQNQIDMYSYQQGIYYLRVTIGKDVIVYKIIKVQ